MKTLRLGPFQLILSKKAENGTKISFSNVFHDKFLEIPPTLHPLNLDHPIRLFAFKGKGDGLT